MWNKKIKKAIFTLCVDGFDKEITEITFPLLANYAAKIGAEFKVIDERKYPDWPVVYEKLQIYDLAREMENDWNIYIDADALVHPDAPDFTVVLPKNTVAHFGMDFAPQRWKYDRFFLRDGRNIGSGNWFTIASDLCVDLWHPLEPHDLTKEEAVANINPTVDEHCSGVIDPSHLIDDYVLSRNIAKYGLKFITIRKIIEDLKINPGLFWHIYTSPRNVKVEKMRQVLKDWRLV